MKTKNNKIAYTQLCTHKKEARLDFRIEKILKDKIKTVCENKELSVSEATRLLWISYLSKINEVEGYEKQQKYIYGVNWEL